MFPARTPPPIGPAPGRLPHRARRRHRTVLAVALTGFVLVTGTIALRQRTDAVATDAGAPPTTRPTTSSTGPPDRRPAGLPRGTTVAVVGDSITNLTSATLRERFDERGFAAPFVSGINGATSADRRRDAPDALGAAAPEVLVVELGANDLGDLHDRDPGATAADLEALADEVVANEQALAAAAGERLRCVVVVDVTTNLEGTFGPAAAATINEGLRAWAHDDLRVQVVSWDAALRNEALTGERGGPMTVDRVHPTVRGAARLADLVVEAMDRCPA